MSNAKRFSFVLLCLCFLILISGCGDNVKNSEEIREVATRLGKKLAENQNLPGLSIAVLREGRDKPVSVTMGKASLENNVPMAPESMIKIGSVTKVFTATLIHEFIEQGKLSYDTPIDKFFPGFPEASRIQVRHLLDHTSGIPDMLQQPEVQSNMCKYWSPKDLIALIATKPLDFEPGTDQRYSNTGYLMLAVICEQISGRSYGDLIRTRLKKPLDMQTLEVGNDHDIVPHLSCGYTTSPKTGLGLPMMASLAIAMGTGNLEAMPSDTVRLVNIGNILKNNVLDTAELKPLKLDNGKIASFESPIGDSEGYTGSYLDGFTLFAFHEPDITLAGKVGSFPGFGTVYLYDRQSKFAVVVSVNNEILVTDAILLGANILNELRP